MKKSYSIFEAKTRFSEIIRIVKEKNDIIVTDRSKPVVRIVPFDQKKSSSLSSRLLDLERLGLVSKNKPKKYKPLQHPSKKNLLDSFLKNRD